MVVLLFQKVFEAVSQLAMSAKGTRLGGEWHAPHMFVSPNLVLPSFFVLQPFTYFIQQTLNANSVPGLKRPGPCPTGSWFRDISRQ